MFSQRSGLQSILFGCVTQQAEVETCKISRSDCAFCADTSVVVRLTPVLAVSSIGR